MNKRERFGFAGLIACALLALALTIVGQFDIASWQVFGVLGLMLCFAVLGASGS